MAVDDTHVWLVTSGHSIVCGGLPLIVNVTMPEMLMLAWTFTRTNVSTLNQTSAE